MTWIGRDLLVTGNNKNYLSLWVIQEDYGQVIEVHKEVLPNKLLAMDSSHPDLLILVMECPSEASSSRVLVMQFMADGEHLLPELITERRLAKDIYDTSLPITAAATAIEDEDIKLG